MTEIWLFAFYNFVIFLLLFNFKNEFFKVNLLIGILMLFMLFMLLMIFFSQFFGA